MAKDRREFTREEKIKHFSARVGDMSLSQNQRDYAAKRLAALTGTKTPASSSPQQNRGANSRDNRNGSNINVYVHHVK